MSRRPRTTAPAAAVTTLLLVAGCGLFARDSGLEDTRKRTLAEVKAEAQAMAEAVVGGAARAAELGLHRRPGTVGYDEAGLDPCRKDTGTNNPYKANRLIEEFITKPMSPEAIAAEITPVDARLKALGYQLIETLVSPVPNRDETARRTNNIPILPIDSMWRKGDKDSTDLHVWVKRDNAPRPDRKPGEFTEYDDVLSVFVAPACFRGES